MIEVKNLTYGETENNFDCEINHEKYGWIPYNVVKDDTEEFGRQLYIDITNGVYGEPSKRVIEIKDEKIV